MENMLPIGHPVYTLGIKQVGKHVNRDDTVTYDYQIYPIRNQVREIRIGRAMTESVFDEHYGPMAKTETNITYLVCPENEQFTLETHATSPCKDYLIAHGTVCGITRRGYLSLSQIRPYAEKLQKAAKTSLSAAGTVSISPEIP